MDYRVISADSHIDLTWLPGDLFTSQAPARLRDRMPRIVGESPNWRWVAGDRELTGMGGIGKGLFSLQKGQSHNLDRMLDTGFFHEGFHGRPRPTNAVRRMEDMARDGVDAEVIYGLVNTADRLQDPELVALVQHIYNDWLAEFCAAHPERWAGLASIPNHDAEIAASETRRAASLGLRGAEFDAAHAPKLLWDHGWEPLWAALEECNLPVSFHAIGTRGMPAQSPDPSLHDDLVYKGVSVTLVGLSAAEFLSSIVLSGALDRHPRLRFVLGESGFGWVPFVLERLDKQYADRLYHLGLSMDPSAFWRRQGHTTFQNERAGFAMLDAMGEDTVLWGSDYPHPDGTWPVSQQVIHDNMGHLDERLRRKIVCDNAARLYGFTAS
ncbi:MAG: amidohydrolase [Dehalococcoidia bacterium]|nr:amidohydrolase [Dehalococcoidia bacterium]